MYIIVPDVNSKSSGDLCPDFGRNQQNARTTIRCGQTAKTVAVMVSVMCLDFSENQRNASQYVSANVKNMAKCDEV